MYTEAYHISTAPIEAYHISTAHFSICLILSDLKHLIAIIKIMKKGIQLLKMSWLERTDQYFRDLNLWSLWIDRAYFNVINRREKDYFLYSLASNCVRCPFRHLRNITAVDNATLVVNTARSMEMKLFDKHHGSHVFPNQSKDGLVWEDTPEMGQFGVYDLILDPSGTNQFEVALEPVPIYWCMKEQKLFILS